MKPMKRKSDCPWTSTRKGKKQRKTTESTSEHKNTTLAQSDKGSWFDQVKRLKEEVRLHASPLGNFAVKSTQKTVQRKETRL